MNANKIGTAVTGPNSRILLVGALLVGASLLAHNPARADDNAENITSCLKAFGKHPFSATPKYKTLAVKVKVFGIGEDTVDSEVTKNSALVFIKPSVNVMGGSVIDLRNPNGWYCMRSSVNVMGGLTIKLPCKAKFAMVSEGTAVLSNKAEAKGITVMGSTTIERDCK